MSENIKTKIAVVRTKINITIHNLRYSFATQFIRARNRFTLYPRTT